MRNYTPFLKLKTNELAALEVLDPELLSRLRPFFDLARKKDMTAESACSMITGNVKKLKRIFEDRPFFLDVFDIPDSIEVDGKNLFYFVSETCADLNFIPVVGLDRSGDYLEAVWNEKAEGRLVSNEVAVRLLEPEFESFDVVKDELATILEDAAEAGFSRFILIMDCRYCLPSDPDGLANMIRDFVRGAVDTMLIDEVVVTGSSIPVKIADVIATDQESELIRIEIAIFAALAPHFDSDLLGFGDYTIVSPYYSEVDLAPEMLPNITAPKVLYTHGDTHYGSRGNALKAHPRGNHQYNDIALSLVGRSFFRGPKYSWGEDFLISKSKMEGKKVTPGSILKPTICTHITYMAKDHPLLA